MHSFRMPYINRVLVLPVLLLLGPVVLPVVISEYCLSYAVEIELPRDSGFLQCIPQPRDTFIRSTSSACGISHRDASGYPSENSYVQTRAPRTSYYFMVALQVHQILLSMCSVVVATVDRNGFMSEVIYLV